MLFLPSSEANFGGTFCHMCFRNENVRVQICDKVLFIDQTPVVCQIGCHLILMNQKHTIEMEEQGGQGSASK